MKLNNKNIEFDFEGYLKNIDEWNESIAIQIAEKENILMNKERWNIVYLMRSFYLQYRISPTTRMLVRATADKYGREKGNSIYLVKLFPEGIIKQASKIAGIPKPSKCL
ncbi:TusE/DsrC/DsvC family sulfur relay protein [Candidatus Pantoea edessiphila]|uniref:Sulfurtransferase n=1 Tax=Candidatus Pantoea edessiphila TaxID=2044610 RepID=A0A2P5SWX8_9GAMM|nr:TusE/DsrC/DsvC family sulfur relay protein [Candidatus Pantoea edessiphila]PPI86848.1 sulfurtransferase TusE [Candidatus Pantoea edessiphila]